MDRSIRLVGTHLTGKEHSGYLKEYFRLNCSAAQPRGRAGQQHHPWRRRRPGDRGSGGPDRVRDPVRQRMAYRELHHLRDHTHHALHCLHPLSQHPDSRGQSRPARSRPCSHFSPDRRNLHPLRAGGYRRPLGLGHFRHRLDDRAARRHLSGLPAPPLAGRLGRSLRRDGLYHRRRHQTPARLPHPDPA